MAHHDFAVQALIQAEHKRQSETLMLIPSENYASREVLGALSSSFTNKYAEGYPGRRYYAGNSVADDLESLAQLRALELFDLDPAAWHVNVQPHSGSVANIAVYTALVKPGEKIMGLQLDMGGHLTHGATPSFTSTVWKSVPYTLSERSEMLDYRALRTQVIKEKPRLIVAGFTAYPQQVDFAEFRNVADSVGAYLLADISHIAGLVAGGVHPSPFPYADAVTTTTHKTLRGPRSALIFCRTEHAKAIDRAIFPGLQGGPHLNQIASVAVALQEAATPAFRTYALRVAKNAAALGSALAKLGWSFVSGGTATHLLLADMRQFSLSGKEASDLLEASGIIANKNAIPFDPNPPLKPSGIRFGTPAMTTRGMKEREMRQVAKLMHRALVEQQSVRREVRELCKQFPIPR